MAVVSFTIQNLKKKKNLLLLCSKVNVHFWRSKGQRLNKMQVWIPESRKHIKIRLAMNHCLHLPVLFLHINFLSAKYNWNILANPDFQHRKESKKPGFETKSLYSANQGHFESTKRWCSSDRFWKFLSEDFLGRSQFLQSTKRYFKTLENYFLQGTSTTKN